MIFISMVRWWYGEGLYGQVSRAAQLMASTADYFSVVALLQTLFAPFRQISAGGSVGGPLGRRWQAWLDRLVSRVVGGVIRLTTVVAGLITLALTALVGLLLIAGWLALPAAPLIGLVMSLTWPA